MRHFHRVTVAMAVLAVSSLAISAVAGAAVSATGSNEAIRADVTSAYRGVGESFLGGLAAPGGRSRALRSPRAASGKPVISKTSGTIGIGKTTDLVVSGSRLTASMTVRTSAPGVSFSVLNVGTYRIVLAVKVGKSVKSGTYRLRATDDTGASTVVSLILKVNRKAKTVHFEITSSI